MAKGFIERPDAEVARAWLQDLANVGYAFPPVVPPLGSGPSGAWGDATCPARSSSSAGSAEGRR